MSHMQASKSPAPAPTRRATPTPTTPTAATVTPTRTGRLTTLPPATAPAFTPEAPVAPPPAATARSIRGPTAPATTSKPCPRGSRLHACRPRGRAQWPMCLAAGERHQAPHRKHGRGASALGINVHVRKAHSRPSMLKRFNPKPSVMMWLTVYTSTLRE